MDGAAHLCRPRSGEVEEYQSDPEYLDGVREVCVADQPCCDGARGGERAFAQAMEGEKGGYSCCDGVQSGNLHGGAGAESQLQVWDTQSGGGRERKRSPADV